jgi:hypothetical protein
MLGRDNQVINSYGFSVLVFKGYLGLSIRPENVDCAILADFCKLLGQKMRPVNRGWHKGRSFIAGIAKHHALVACALVFHFFAQNPLRDIGGLVIY